MSLPERRSLVEAVVVADGPGLQREEMGDAEVQAVPG